MTLVTFPDDASCSCIDLIGPVLDTGPDVDGTVFANGDPNGDIFWFSFVSNEDDSFDIVEPKVFGGDPKGEEELLEIDSPLANEDVKEGFLPKGEVFLTVSSFCFMSAVENEDAVDSLLSPSPSAMFVIVDDVDPKGDPDFNGEAVALTLSAEDKVEALFVNEDSNGAGDLMVFLLSTFLVLKGESNGEFFTDLPFCCVSPSSFALSLSDADADAEFLKGDANGDEEEGDASFLLFPTDGNGEAATNDELAINEDDPKREVLLLVSAISVANT